MKDCSKLVLTFVLFACLLVIVITSAKQVEREIACDKQTHELVYMLNGDTTSIKVCDYSTKVFNLVSDNTYFYYCEHVSDSTHIKRLFPIDQYNFVKIIKYK